MKTFLEHLNQEILDEGALHDIGKHIQKGLNIVSDASRKAVDSVIPKDFAPRTLRHEINTGPVQVKKIDASNVRNFQIRPDFHPTHIIKINGIDHIIGNELGKEGPQVYQIRHAANGITTKNIPGFRLLHEHPILHHTFIGRNIYKANRDAFNDLPITASKGDINRVMKMKTTDNRHGVPVVTMQYLALHHPNAGPHVVDALIKNSEAAPEVLKKAMTMHGVSRDQAREILNSPHITDQVIISTAHDRLTRP